ncbi:MAG: hypothetical protein HY520_01580 [Candidatus Aenigmarchaeota archaeon]|nr:hypothetical protein [Candidatus Aenigmarchaeota archaeon]
MTACAFSPCLHDYRGPVEHLQRHLAHCPDCRDRALLVAVADPARPAIPTPACADDATLAAFVEAPALKGVAWWDQVASHAGSCNLCLRKARALVAARERRQGHGPSARHSSAVLALVSAEQQAGRPFSDHDVISLAAPTGFCPDATIIAAYNGTLPEGAEQLLHQAVTCPWCAVCSPGGQPA